MMKRCSC